MLYGPQIIFIWTWFCNNCWYSNMCLFISIGLLYGCISRYWISFKLVFSDWWLYFTCQIHMKQQLYYCETDIKHYWQDSVKVKWQVSWLYSLLWYMPVHVLCNDWGRFSNATTILFLYWQQSIITSFNDDMIIFFIGLSGIHINQ